MRFSPGCQCCPTGPTICGKSSVPASYDVTVTGISGTCGASSNDCTVVNKTWTMVQSPGFGFWQDTDPNDVSATLECIISPGTMRLTITADGLETCAANYSLSEASWDPFGSNVMNLDASDDCSGWPATLTVTPT